ncbi:secreted phosphoprotein 24 isoform X1 [Scomber japonicus]|uniref:secreted phosphoprotein 24 isoform X1 n=2 Tax=Scomber japonicus TaxID=13676 RepID=UPI002305FA01|nr:secreted phosphoprotein 24 isoform X1 [Scomber japonicus]
MRSYMLLLVLLQFLGCSGIPLSNPELEAMAEKALGAALTEVNTVYAASRLYRVTHGSVTRVIPTGQSTSDLMLSFGIKETDCATASGSDPQTCAYRTGFFVRTLSCTSRVRMFPASTQVVSLKCGGGSSSSESSEEMFRGRHQFNFPSANRVPGPTPQTGQERSLHGQAVNPRLGGDGLNNYLE